MVTDANAARRSSDGERKIQIADWKPHSKNSLRGFFTATLPSGMVLHDLMLRERDGSRWIGFPAREWVDRQDVRQYVRVVEFCDRDTANRFRDQMLDALDEHLESLS